MLHFLKAAYHANPGTEKKLAVSSLHASINFLWKLSNKDIHIQIPNTYK